MIKTVVFLLLAVTIFSLKASHCPPGHTYVIHLAKCEPVSKMCTINQYYDKKHQACYSKSVLCTTAQKYDSKTHKCVAISTKCKAGYVFNHQLQQCMKKIVCKTGYTLNLQYQICEKVIANCSVGQQYDYLTKKCVTLQYITSPFEPHLIVPGNYQTYVKTYTKAKKANHLLLDCPVKKPFYQKSSKKCIICPTSTPYFDIATDKCIKCSFSTYYNPNSHKCVSQTQIPTYPKTISRIGY